MTHPTPREKDAMKNIERLLQELIYRVAEESKARPWNHDLAERTEEARDALLAAIRKLVSSTLPATWERGGKKAVLGTYERLHANKLGAHWLWCVIERIAAGASEAEAFGEYGYRLRSDADAASPTIQQAGKVLEALTKMRLALHYAAPTDIDSADEVRHARDAGDAAIALLRSLPQEEAAAQMQQWQPIETAPQDGRKVVLLISTAGPNGYVTDPWTGWASKDGSFARWPHDFPPTHWMPLPPPPLHRSEQSTDKEQG